MVDIGFASNHIANRSIFPPRFIEFGIPILDLHELALLFYTWWRETLEYKLPTIRTKMENMECFFFEGEDMECKLRGSIEMQFICFFANWVLYM